MLSSKKEISNLSYTNKDFQQIYPELLDLASRLSYKWNPVESDESDPGVVLLKLAAIIADKNNYNIDKNILELFPLSVTQESNARQIFDQCGYRMRHYLSAQGTLGLTLIKEPDITEDTVSKFGGDMSVDMFKTSYVRNYVIPRFTTVSDINNEIVYTTTDDVTIQSTGEEKTVSIIQGIPINYKINDSELITSAQLDYNNRLYFTEHNIAENGIFIAHAGRSNYHEWRCVDNIALYAEGNYVYEFGITPDGTHCYIEFPADIDNIIGEGLNITYILSSGKEGNVSRSVINKFHTDLTIDRTLAEFSLSVGDEVKISAENVSIINRNSITNGKDPETIDEAYKQYEKTIGTFSTLVTLRDYMNYMYANKLVSNSVVCDRTNDIQSSYKIYEDRDTYTETHYNVKISPKTDEDSKEEPELTPFDLKVYALCYSDNVEMSAGENGFKKTFELIPATDEASSAWNKLMSEISNSKCVQHDFKPFIKDRMLILKNRYPIHCKIIPQSKLSYIEEEQVRLNVYSALSKALNAREVEFGSEIDYALVFDTITNADPRIKAITLDYFSYETYAVYYTDVINLETETPESLIRELRIDANSIKPSIETSNEYQSIYENNVNDPRLELIKQNVEKEGNLWDVFRSEIYAQCVLAGVTPFYVPAEPNFSYSLQHRDSAIHENVISITTNTDIEVDWTSETRGETRELLKNENIVLTAPNLIEDSPYSTYVKFIHNIGRGTSNEPEANKPRIRKNEEYHLEDGEFIIFFWKDSDEETAPYKYRKYTNESDSPFISTTFVMYDQDVDKKMLTPGVLNYFAGLPEGEGTTESCSGLLNVSLTEGKQTYVTVTNFVKQLMGSEFVLTGNATITTKKINQIYLNDASGINEIFWIRNNSHHTGSSLLFDNKTYTYILKQGEYLFYRNKSKTQLNILGAGTQISAIGLDENHEPWECIAVDYDTLMSSSDSYLDEPTADRSNKWFKIPSKVQLEITEMAYTQLGPGTKLILKTTAKELVTKLNNSNTPLYDYDISYINEEDEIEIPRRKDSLIGWQASTILNLSMSNVVSQQLVYGQSIQLARKNVDDPYKIEPKSELYDLICQSNIPLEITGGSNIDVTFYEDDGSKGNLVIYSATLDTPPCVEIDAESDSPKASSHDYDGYETTVTLVRNKNDSSNVTYELTYNLPSNVSADEYNFIVPITIDNVAFNSVTITDASNKPLMIQPGIYQFIDIKKSGTYYAQLPDNTFISTLKINASFNSNITSGIIKFGEVFDCKLNKGSLSDLQLSSVKSLLAYYDNPTQDELVNSSLITSGWMLRSSPSRIDTRWSFDTQTNTITLTVNSDSGETGGPTTPGYFSELETYIQHIVIKGNCTTISANAFTGLENLKSVVIPPSVTEIGSNAFDGCTKLSEVSVEGQFNLENVINFSNINYWVESKKTDDKTTFTINSPFGMTANKAEGIIVKAPADDSDIDKLREICRHAPVGTVYVNNVTNTNTDAESAKNNIESKIIKKCYNVTTDESSNTESESLVNTKIAYLNTVTVTDTDPETKKPTDKSSCWALIPMYVDEEDTSTTRFRYIYAMYIFDFKAEIELSEYYSMNTISNIKYVVLSDKLDISGTVKIKNLEAIIVTGTYTYNYVDNRTSIPFNIDIDPDSPPNINILYPRAKDANADVSKLVDDVTINTNIITDIVRRGDLNGDGKIDASDAILLAQYLAGWESVKNTVDETAANCDGKNDVDSRDAVLLAQYIAGWEVELAFIGKCVKFNSDGDDKKFEDSDPLNNLNSQQANAYLQMKNWKLTPVFKSSSDSTTTVYPTTYNYVATIDSNKQILDPLVASSFLQSSHVFNPFTICQWTLPVNKNNVVEKTIVIHSNIK